MYFASYKLFPSDVSVRQTVDFMVVVSGNNNDKIHIFICVSCNFLLNNLPKWVPILNWRAFHFCLLKLSVLKIVVKQKLEMPWGTLRKGKDIILPDRLFYISTTWNWPYGHSTFCRDFLFLGFKPVSPISFYSAL